MIHFKPFTFGKAEKTTIGILAFVILLSIGIVTVPFIATSYAELTRAWSEIALRYGYIGALISAFVGSITPVIVFPYTIVIFFLATQGLNPWVLGLMMGLGAGIGQFSGYFLGMWSSRLLKKRPATFQALQKLVHARPVFVHWVLFLFAVTPLPDAALFIPLGMIRYGWIKILLPTLAGKITSGLIVTLSSNFLAQSFNFDAAASSTTLISQMSTLASIAVIIYVVLKLDWEKMIHRWFDPKGEILGSSSNDSSHA